MEISGRIIGDGQPAYIIAEMSANHAGSIERAKEIIHAAKDAGADCVKIQTYTADTITMNCTNEYFQIKTGTWKKENLYELYQKAYTPWEWQGQLKAEAQRIGLDFFSTPFDKTAVDFLEELEMDFYKIASFEIVDIPLIKYVASKGKPVIMSTGMATFAEIEEAVQTIRNAGNEQIALLRCASAYPAISDEMNLATMMDMHQQFGVEVGLSDHSMGSLAAVTAIAMGGSIIEKHFCISRDIENPDASFSMEPQEFRNMVDEIRRAERARGIVKYGPTMQERTNLAFRKSIFVTQDIRAGEPYTTENIRVIRPANGLHPREYEGILGKRASRDLKRGTPLKAENVDNYLQIVKADKEDMELLFEWTNEYEVRNNSFSHKVIEWDEHQNWMEKTLTDPNRYLYIAIQNEKKIGMIRFDLADTVAELSYSIEKESRGRGYGKQLIIVGIHQMQKECPEINYITAKVKPGNLISQRIFQGAGFIHQEDGGTEYVLYSYRCK